jgi:hypothetical protein
LGRRPRDDHSLLPGERRALVCWIIVLIQIFKRQHIALGVIGILCPIVAFVYGWIKAREWAIMNIMLAWTACIVLQILIGAIGGAFTAHVNVR